jgi:hypothetical protein
MLQIDIWEDHKIFDNQGQSVRDEFLRRLKDLKKELVSDLILFHFSCVLSFFMVDTLFMHVGVTPVSNNIQ